MRSWRVLSAVGVAVFVALWALSYVLPSAVSAVLFAVFTVGVGLWVNRLAAHRRRRSGADRLDSVEREAAAAAAWTTLPVALVTMAALAAWAAASGAPEVAMGAFAAKGVVAVTYWCSYAAARARY